MNEGSRRAFITGVAASAGAALTACHASIPNRAASGNGLTPSEKPVCDQMNEVLPVEDLMREHGVLRRVLLVYGEAARRLDGLDEASPKVLVRAATLVKRFVHDYHEKNEENDLFPRFERAGKRVALVRTLREQHEAGRVVTGRILARASAPTSDADSRRALASDLRAFVAMYEPHAAREDTVLFPELHALVTPREYDELSDKFEDTEHELFGKDGFERIVGEVGEIESAYGVEDLAKFTPR